MESHPSHNYPSRFLWANFLPSYQNSQTLPITASPSLLHLRASLSVLSTATAVAAIWEVSQQIKDLSLLLSIAAFSAPRGALTPVLCGSVPSSGLAPLSSLWGRAVVGSRCPGPQSPAAGKRLTQQSRSCFGHTAFPATLLRWTGGRVDGWTGGPVDRRTGGPVDLRTGLLGTQAGRGLGESAPWRSEPASPETGGSARTKPGGQELVPPTDLFSHSDIKKKSS